MQFENVQEFISMGGYGVYVWLSFGISFALLLINWVVPKRQEKELHKELSSWARQKDALKAKQKECGGDASA